jgi:hypothetical protein
MKIVIIAFEHENHTAPLKWALEQAGFTVAFDRAAGRRDVRT